MNYIVGPGTRIIVNRKPTKYKNHVFISIDSTNNTFRKMLLKFRSGFTSWNSKNASTDSQIHRVFSLAFLKSRVGSEVSVLLKDESKLQTTTHMFKISSPSQSSPKYLYHWLLSEVPEGKSFTLVNAVEKCQVWYHFESKSIDVPLETAKLYGLKSSHHFSSSLFLKSLRMQWQEAIPVWSCGLEWSMTDMVSGENMQET